MRVALIGNPNTGKSTVFNALTGLRQHTGNWPGKTVARAEGVFKHGGKSIKVVDLPGTYSLQAGSTDEEVARDLLSRDPRLRAEFEQRLRDDPAFAKNPAARLDFFYRKHPAYDPDYNRYPIVRVGIAP